MITSQKTNQKSGIFYPLGYENYPDSARAHITDTGTENYERQNHIGTISGEIIDSTIYY